MTIKPTSSTMGQKPLEAAQSTGDLKRGSVGTEKSPSPSTGASDTVTLTRSAMEMADLVNQLTNLPSVNQARIDSIKAAITDGSYQIDPEQVIDQLLKFERQLD